MEEFPAEFPAADTSEFNQQYDKYNTKLNSPAIEG